MRRYLSVVILCLIWENGAFAQSIMGVDLNPDLQVRLGYQALNLTYSFGK